MILSKEGNLIAVYILEKSHYQGFLSLALRPNMNNLSCPAYGPRGVSNP